MEKQYRSYEEAEKIIESVMKDMAAVGIPFIKPRRVTYKHLEHVHAWCVRKEDGSFELEIDSSFLDRSVPVRELKTLMMHELVHTCPGCMDHNKQFFQYTKKMHDFDPDYQKSGATNSPYIYKRHFKFKNKLICPKCGRINMNDQPDGDVGYCTMCGKWLEELPADFTLPVT